MTLAKAKENLDTKNTLPHGWRWVLLEDLFDVKQGAAMSPVRRQGIAPRPFLRTLNVLWGSVDLSNLDKMDFGENEVKDLNLRSGDLLVCEGGDVGRTAIWRGELDSCLYQNHIHRLRRRNSGVAPEFYAYWMQAAFKVFHSYKGKEITTTIPNLSGGKLKSFLIPLPPTLAEQERIAGILNEQIEAVDKARAAAETRLEAAKALPAAYLRAVFPKTGQELPPGWRWERLGKVGRFDSGGTPAKENSQFWNGDIPFVTGADITELYISAKHARAYLTESGLRSGKTAVCEPDTILFVTRTRVGRVGIASELMGASQDLSPFICGTELVPEFVARYISNISSSLIENCRGATIQGLTREFVHQIEIPLPPLTEQKHILAILNKQMGAAGKMAQTIQHELETINALPAALLRRAFSGGM